MAEFSDVSPILVGQQVKVHGVTVGKVGEPNYLPNRKIALVPLYLDATALPVHTDATARIAPLSLLGERYVNLDQGTPSAPDLPMNASITVDHTGQDQDLQSILDTLDDPTAASLAALVTTLGQGADGNGANIQKTLAALEPAMKNTDQLVKVLSDQNELLGQVVDQVQPVTSALAADNGKTLDGLVGSATALLNSSADRDAQLRSTLAELPSTLATAQQTLADLTGTSQAATTTLGNLRPTTDNLAQISQELGTFADSANPALASADPVLDRAKELLDAAQPVAAELRAAGPNLQQSIAGARPIVSQLNGNLGNVLGFIRNWALTTNEKDGLSHYFRAQFVINPDAVSGFLPGGLPSTAPILGSNPNPPDQLNQPGPSPATNGTPQEAQQGASGGLLQSQPDPGGSATGLSPQQEQGAAGFLLGGK
jgi:phospholipid/cholesterol/gamma-HCH transport system substrate-binding protein